MSTNPVVVRRIVARRRDDGFVQGRDGSWTIAGNLIATTAQDIFVALGKPGSSP